MASLLSNYLKALKVPHTATYADSCFKGMAFRTLFGLERVLEQFGVESRGLKFSDKGKVTELTPPFLAQVHGGVAIVTGLETRDGNTIVDCQSFRGRQSYPLAEFLETFTGVVLQSRVTPGAKEKDLGEHRFEDFANKLKVPVMVAVLAFLAVFGSIRTGVWDSVWKAVSFGLDVAGIGVCYLLWLKTNGIKSRVADSMCGLTTEHGCDKVLDTRASSFLGIFKWSEVGMGYFAVSLMALVIFPETWGDLAMLNACCLPYTVWSVTYQKFVIKAWCTLCLTVQTLLWCLAACYFFGGAWRGASIGMPTFLLLGGYVSGVLLMNFINSFINKAKNS